MLGSFHLCEQILFPSWYAQLEHSETFHFKYFLHSKNSREPSNAMLLATLCFSNSNWFCKSLISIKVNKINEKKKVKMIVFDMPRFYFSKKRPFWFFKDNANTHNLTAQFHLGEKNTLLHRKRWCNAAVNTPCPQVPLWTQHGAAIELK